MTASLAHGREMQAVPGDIQGDLIRLTGPVEARDRGDAKERTIYAT